jgi:hypothetical protein
MEVLLRSAVHGGIRPWDEARLQESGALPPKQAANAAKVR